MEATNGFAAFERQVAVPALRRLDAGEPFDPAFAALGVLAPEARVEAFYERSNIWWCHASAHSVSMAHARGASATVRPAERERLVRCSMT